MPTKLTDITSTGFAQPAYHSYFNLADVGSCSALKITSILYSLLKCQIEKDLRWTTS